MAGPLKQNFFKGLPEEAEEKCVYFYSFSTSMKLWSIDIENKKSLIVTDLERFWIQPFGENGSQPGSGSETLI